MRSSKDLVHEVLGILDGHPSPIMSARVRSCDHVPSNYDIRPGDEVNIVHVTEGLIGMRKDAPPQKGFLIYVDGKYITMYENELYNFNMK